MFGCGFNDISTRAINLKIRVINMSIKFDLVQLQKDTQDYLEALSKFAAKQARKNSEIEILHNRVGNLEEDIRGIKDGIGESFYNSAKDIVVLSKVDNSICYSSKYLAKNCLVFSSNDTVSENVVCFG